MSGTPLTLTAEEREFLVGLLEIALREKLIEEHRSRKPTYREYVLQQELLLESILGRLREVSHVS
jgi:hypothetical protein